MTGPERVTHQGRGGDEQTTQVEAFARAAARDGWSRATLQRFCAAKGIAEAEAARLWPDGVRSLGRAFNDIADARMQEALGGRQGLSLTAIIMARFKQNADWKASVARLAWSDLFHPLDTLGRTSTSADVMVSIRSGSQPRSVRWRLTVAYCIAVLVWLADRTVDQRLTRRAVQASLFLVGLR